MSSKGWRLEVASERGWRDDGPLQEFTWLFLFG